jgi:DNA-binding NarL/FixJ family response regulator
MENAGSEPVRIALLHFEPLRITGLLEILSSRTDFDVTASDLAGTFRWPAFDVGLLPARSGSEWQGLLTRLRLRHPEMKLVIMGSGGSDETIMAALSSGAKGWIEDTASPEQIIQAIDVVLGGSAWAPRRVLAVLVERAFATQPVPRGPRELPKFTGREAEVLKHLVLARSNREIAQALSIREQTVKSYVTRLMRKMGVANRIALSMEAAGGDWWHAEEV